MNTPTPRDGELTSTVRRELFDELPEDVTAPEDVARWEAWVEDYHRAQRLEGVRGFPLQVDIELNSTCQLACRFCLHGQGVVPKQLMSFIDFARVIREGEEYGLVSIKLNYINEPLLRRDLEQFIQYAKEHGVLNVYLATNGLLLTKKRSRSLIEAGLTKLLVSIDATTPETFLKMRGSPRYQTVVDNIRGFIEVRNEMGRRFPLVRVNFLRTAENLHEAEVFLEEWDGLADMVGFQSQVAVPGVDGEPLAVEVQPGPFRCSFPSKLVVVDSSGLLLPCCTFSGRSMPVGTIGKRSIKQAWDSMNELRALHKRGGYAENPICRHCVEGS